MTYGESGPPIDKAADLRADALATIGYEIDGLRTAVAKGSHKLVAASAELVVTLLWKAVRLQAVKQFHADIMEQTIDLVVKLDAEYWQYPDMLAPLITALEAMLKIAEENQPEGE